MMENNKEQDAEMGQSGAPASGACDALLITFDFVVPLQSIASRSLDPRTIAALSCTNIRVDEWNAIAAGAEISGDC
jgi:metal-dependent amidase/aminoacylase/carboxypeptidase family protein